MKLVIGLPWYNGPDAETGPLYMDMMMYFGALRERTLMRSEMPRDAWMATNGALPPLDETGDPEGNPTEEDYDRLGKLQIALVDYSRCSLVGKAREMIVDVALEWGADYLFWWDSDMKFSPSSFLRLFRNNVPVVGALAFTARHPIYPVIFSIKKSHDPLNNMQVLENSDIMFDYPKDKLVGNEDVGGELAMGGACVLYNMNVFKEIPKPWFMSTGCGEDWFFCHRCAEYGIPRYVDTRVKTEHKEHASRWATESAYWQYREMPAMKESYDDLMFPKETKVL